MKIIKEKKGFTLIELIIVISIIAILSAISVPKYGKIQKDAKVKADIASAKVIGDTVTTLIAEDVITGAIKSDYLNGKELGDEIKEYLQTVPVTKAVTDEFNVKIDVNDNVFVTVATAQLYPSQVGEYPPVD